MKPKTISNKMFKQKLKWPVVDNQLNVFNQMMTKRWRSIQTHEKEIKIQNAISNVLMMWMTHICSLATVNCLVHGNWWWEEKKVGSLRCVFLLIHFHTNRKMKWKLKTVLRIPTFESIHHVVLSVKIYWISHTHIV